MDTEHTFLQKYGQAILVTSSGFIGFIPLMILPVMVGAFVDFQQFSQKAAGVICSVHLFGVAIGILLLSRFSLRIGLKENVRYAACLVFLIECLALIYEALPVILLCRFFSGLGGGVIAGCTYTWLVNSHDPDRGFGLYLLVQFLLGALLLYIIPLGLSAVGLGAISLSFIVFAALATLFADAFSSAGSDGHEVVKQISFRKILAGENSIPALLSVGLFELAMSVVWAYAERIGTIWQLSPANISQALAMASVTGIFGALLVVLLGAKLGRWRSVLLGVLAVVVVQILFVMSGWQSVLIFAGLLMLFNAAWAFTVPYLQGMQAGLGSGSGVVCLGAFVIMASLSAGPALSGLVAESYGLVGVVVFSIILLAICLCCVRSTLSFQARKSLKEIGTSVQG